MGTVKRLWSIITTLLVIAVVIMAILIVGVKLVGIQPYAVLSGSMEPTYPVGSLIYDKKVDASTLQEGDVITFMISEDMVATHRIVAIVPDEEYPSVLRFQTKGDANADPDAGLVHYKNVVGTPVFKIPMLGYVAEFVKRPPGLYIAIAVAALLLLLEFLPDLIFPDEEEEEEKKKNESVQNDDKSDKSE